MAAAVVTTTVNKQVAGLPGYKVQATLAISASPATYTTGGIAMNLNQASIKASRTPRNVVVTGIGGYTYSYVKGSDNSNGLLRIFAQTSGAAEDDPLGQLTGGGAIPAGVSGDTITATIEYDGQN